MDLAACCCLGTLAVGAGGLLVADAYLLERPYYHTRWRHFDPVCLEIRARVTEIAERVLQSKNAWFAQNPNVLSAGEARRLNEMVDRVYVHLRSHENYWPIRIQRLKLGKLFPDYDFVGRKYQGYVNRTSAVGALVEILRSVPEVTVSVRTQEHWFHNDYKLDINFGWEHLRLLQKMAWAEEDRLYYY